MKQEITAQVVMLPQDKEGWDEDDILSDSECHLKIATYDRETCLEDWTPQHLYFTTDEPIKEGDWYTWKDGTIRKSTRDNKPRPDCNGYKVVASTDPTLGLPTIPTTWIRDEYVPSNGSIKEVRLELEFNHALKSMATESRIKLTPNNEVVIVDEPTEQPIDPTYRHYRFDEDVALKEGMKIMDAKWPVKQQHIVDQELEDAANNWIDSHYNKGVEYSKAKRGAANPKSGFIAGAAWQKEQSATDAVEMLQWLVEQDNAVLLYEGLIQHKASAKELSKQLYELWQQNQKKSTMS